MALLSRIDATKLTQLTQRKFEERLCQQLGEMNSSMRRAHADEYERLAGSLLDMAIIVRRLEAKLDRIVEGSTLQEGSSARERAVRMQPTNDRQRSRPGEGLGERAEGAGSSNKKNLFALIQEICSVDRPFNESALKQNRSREHLVSEETQKNALPEEEVAIKQQKSSDSLETDGELQLKGASQQIRTEESKRNGVFDTEQPIGTSVHVSDIPDVKHSLHKLVEVDRKVDVLSDSLSKKLERIAYALGIRNLNVVDNGGDDAEDRKRLKEKLKAAYDIDRRSKRVITSGKEKWLDYIFGICRPDQRIGKRGSRFTFVELEPKYEVQS